jgi:hypothetical protein
MLLILSYVIDFSFYYSELVQDEPGVIITSPVGLTVPTIAQKLAGSPGVTVANPEDPLQLVQPTPPLPLFIVAE